MMAFSTTRSRVIDVRAFMERRTVPEPNTGCWLWTGTMDLKYGIARLGPKNDQKAHRVWYELVRGPIPDGLELDHLCRTPLCVNPDHLEPVTTRVNVLRSECPPAKNARKTHCKRGHPLTGENLKSQRRGKGRRCAACCRLTGREASRRYAARHRGAGAAA